MDVGYVVAIVEVAAPLAFLVSLALLRIYRRAVVRSMHRRTAAEAVVGSTDVLETRSARSSEPPGHSLEITFQEPPAASVQFVVRSALWRSAAVQVTAGLAYALVMTLSFLSAGPSFFDFYWPIVLYLTVYFAWPMVISVGLASAVSWRGFGMLVVGYALVFGGVVTIITIEDTVSMGLTASQLWLNINGFGTLLVLTFLARPIRAVGPLVMVFMMAAVAGTLLTSGFLSDENNQLVIWMATTVTELKLGVVGGYAASVLALLTGAVAMGIIGWLLLRRLGSLYRSRWISDQSILIDTVWLMFSFLHVPQAAWSGHGALGAIGAFVAYKLVATAGFRLLRSKAEKDAQASKLLLLRVFSPGAPNERAFTKLWRHVGGVHLFEGFTNLWRHMGSVRMIAGPDLATSTVEPHEFLDFLAGRLQRRFITGPDTLEQRLGETEQRRDLDGRFRVAEFFCHDDTWQMVFRRLEKDSDAVLMDLRGFCPSNRGCVFEIDELLATVPLHRIVFVIDRRTDERFLAQVFAAGWAKVTGASPNWSDPAPRVRLYYLDPRFGLNIPALVAAIAGASVRYPIRNETSGINLPVTHGLQHNPPVQLRGMSCA